MNNFIDFQPFDSTLAEYLFMNGSKYYSIPVTLDDLYVDSIGWILPSYTGHVAIYDVITDRGNIGHIIYRIGDVYEQNFRLECKERHIEFEVLDEAPRQKRRKTELDDQVAVPQTKSKVLLSIDLPASALSVTIQNLVTALIPYF